MRVLSLAPVLIHIMPADIEDFVSKWPSIKSNLFAQVVISWVSEPCAMTYLATKLKPGATPAATYAILLDACKLMTPPHLAAVAHDITGRGSMKTAGLLAAMVGLGVACTPLSATATRAVPGSSQGAGLALPAKAATIPRLPQQAEAPSPHFGLTGFIGKTARSQEPHAHQPAGHRNLSSSISEAHVFGPWSIQAAAVTTSNSMSQAAKPEARMFNACHRRPSAAASHYAHSCRLVRGWKQQHLRNMSEQLTQPAPPHLQRGAAHLTAQSVLRLLLRPSRPSRRCSQVRGPAGGPQSKLPAEFRSLFPPSSPNCSLTFSSRNNFSKADIDMTTAL